MYPVKLKNRNDLLRSILCTGIQLRKLHLHASHQELHFDLQNIRISGDQNIISSHHMSWVKSNTPTPYKQQLYKYIKWIISYQYIKSIISQYDDSDNDNL